MVATILAYRVFAQNSFLYFLTPLKLLFCLVHRAVRPRHSWRGCKALLRLFGFWLLLNVL